MHEIKFKRTERVDILMIARKFNTPPLAVAKQLDRKSRR